MKTASIERILAARKERRAVALVTDLGSGAQLVMEETGGESAPNLSKDVVASILSALADDRSGEIDANGRKLFVQCFVPAHRILVVGAVHITQALAPLAEILGYSVKIVDPRRAFASEERFPEAEISHEWPDEAMSKWKPDKRTAVVTLTHDPKLDDPALIAALRSPAFYIGALGSKRTHASRLERLRQAGISDPELARIHGPAGLDIGAKSPSEIALSVLAELTVERHGKRRQ